MSISDLPGSSGKKAKATLTNAETSTEVEFQFNPNTLTISRTPAWEDGRQFSVLYPSLQWKGSTHDSLSFDVVLDESECRPEGMAATAAALNPVVNLGPAAKWLGLTNEDSVMKTLQKLFALSKPDLVKDTNPNEIRPPLVHFEWNKFLFTGMITKLETKITLFDEKGSPRRAKVSISIKGRVGLGEKVEFKKTLGPQELL